MMFENNENMSLQKSEIENCKYICESISQGVITLEFLKQTATGVSPQTLAEVIILLKESGKSPAGLNEIINANSFPVYDIVGTGGTGGFRLNTSTLTALFAPQFGLNIVKHGGRSSTGDVGSHEFVESLGICLEKMHASAPEFYRSTGVLFLAAESTYPIFAKSAPLRKQFASPTLFNLLGPLLNPVPVKGKIIGAYNPDVGRLLAQTCQYLNEVAIVVTSQDKEGFLDEASPFATTTLHFCKDRKVHSLNLELVENLSWSRTHLFLDPIKVTNSLFSLKKCKETQVAKKLIAYNLALLFCLHEFVSIKEKNLENFYENISIKIKKLYAMILSNFDVHTLRVKERINVLAKLQPLHENSPIYTKLGAIASNFVMPENLFMPTNLFRPVQNGVHSKNKEHLFIAEIKLARPHKNFNSSLSLQERLKAYEQADAISVVTHPSFSGSLELLKEVRKLTKKPILAKDFIRTPEKIIALKDAGANGVLLLKDMLTSIELLNLLQCCKNLGVTSFVESSFYFPDEGDYSVLNSRSLFSLQENKKYRDFISHTKAKHNIKTIIASSLDTPLEARLALSQNAGCIVGSALMEKETEIDIVNFIYESKKTDPLIKVCGARARHDLKLALNEGVNFVGINLIPSSKRFIGKTNLLSILPELEKIQQHICFITREDACVELIPLISHLNCYEQAYSVPLLPSRRGLFLAQNINYYMGTNAVILDGEEPGNGKVFHYPINQNQLAIPAFISGGLTCENVFSRKQEAEKQAWNVVGVDCASAVCFEDLNINLNMNANSFSKEKIENFINTIKP